VHLTDAMLLISWIVVGLALFGLSLMKMFQGIYGENLESGEIDPEEFCRNMDQMNLPEACCLSVLIMFAAGMEHYNFCAGLLCMLVFHLKRFD
jgi:hypothetical protein